MIIMSLLLFEQVDWEEEQECFKQLATEISLFYCLQYDRFLVDCEEQHDATVCLHSNIIFVSVFCSQSLL